MRQLILLPHIQVHNANALSSPYTIGFPAMSAWLGAAHALQRSVRQKGFPDFTCKSLAVCCHSMNLQTHKNRGDYVYSIIGTGNPLDKTGARPAFIEEARCHLDVSLVLEYSGLEIYQLEELIELISRLLHSNLKLAGGDILRFQSPQISDANDEKGLKKLLQKLTPGYVILERRSLMKEAMNSGFDAINAILSYLQVNHSSEVDESGLVNWHSHRKTQGWIVPIATGFHGIGPLGHAENQRDPDTPHRFAESVITLGEFVMPYRISNLDEMLWHYHIDSEKNLYLCQQNTLKEKKNG